MEKFLSQPEEKQKNIIDAALAIFGKMGYKKASMNDIAIAAGISKGLVFHYFGNKQALYLYLIEFSGNTLLDEMNRCLDKNISDFFDRIRHVTEIKMSLLKKYPAILLFLGSMYNETDKEVTGNIKGILTQSEKIRSDLTFDGIDASKFKEGIDPQLVVNILIKFSEGYVNDTPNTTELDFDKLLSEFEACLTLMKNNFYKEEFLK